MSSELDITATFIYVSKKPKILKSFVETLGVTDFTYIQLLQEINTSRIICENNNKAWSKKYNPF